MKTRKRKLLVTLSILLALLFTCVMPSNVKAEDEDATQTTETENPVYTYTKDGDTLTVWVDQSSIWHIEADHKNLNSYAGVIDYGMQV